MSGRSSPIARTCARSFATAAAALALVGLFGSPASARAETAIKPASGPAGTKITVTGSDWGADTVEIFWANDKGEYELQGTADVDKNRNFSFEFKAPSGKVGSHNIMVRPKGNTVAANQRVRPFNLTGGSKSTGVEIKEGCTGDDHSPPYEDPNTGEPIDTPSIITVGASVDGAPEGAAFHMGITAPDGTLLPIDSAVDGTGRVAGATGIDTFGLYVATEPIVISFTDPNTGQQVSARIDPSRVFPADGFEVGPVEVPCDATDLPPGTLLEVTQPPPGGTGSQPPGTGSQPPPVQPPEQPPSGDTGTPWPWFLVIGGGIVLIGVGTVVVAGGKREEPDLVHPGWEDAGPPTTSVEQGPLPEREGSGDERPPPSDDGPAVM